MLSLLEFNVGFRTRLVLQDWLHPIRAMELLREWMDCQWQADHIQLLVAFSGQQQQVLARRAGTGCGSSSWCLIEEPTNFSGQIMSTLQNLTCMSQSKKIFWINRGRGITICRCGYHHYQVPEPGKWSVVEEIFHLIIQVAILWAIVIFG